MQQLNLPGKGVVIQEPVRLRWSNACNAPHLAWRNERVLQAINLLEEAHRFDSGYEEQQCREELTRLGLKLDMVLELMGELVRQHENRPQPISAEMSASGIRWMTTNPPPLGALVCLELYLSEEYPLPVELLARIDVISNESGQTQVTGVYQATPEAVAEGLEKLIFRRHRRSVANARQKGDE